MTRVGGKKKNEFTLSFALNHNFEHDVIFVCVLISGETQEFLRPRQRAQLYPMVSTAGHLRMSII